MSSGWVFAETTDFFAEYEIGEKLGGGAYGKVYKCVFKANGDVRAVKCIQKQHFQNEFDLFRHEVSIMRELDHPNIVKFHGFYETYKLLYIVMEYCEGGELFRSIRKKFAPRGFIHRNAPCLLKLFGLVKPKVYSEREVANWIHQTLQGLEYLHSKRIVHADIKPQNLMLKFNEEEKSSRKSKITENPIKIIDFGLASVVKKKHLVRGQDGTPEYMSPECIRGKYTIHSDMWSIGVLLFTLLYGFSPFWTESVYDTYQLIVKHGFCPEGPTGSHGNSFPTYISVSDDAKDLITRLLRKDPVDRLSASEALAHPWFSSASSEAISSQGATSVVQNIHKQSQRSKLHKLVLEMLIESITDEDLEAWKSDLSMVSRSNGGVVDFAGLKTVLAGLREQGSNSGLFSPVQLMSPTVASPRARDANAPPRPRRALPNSPLAGFAPLPNATKNPGESYPKISSSVEKDDFDRGAISLRELLIQTVEMKLLAKEERVWSAFDAIDEDGSGCINAVELAKALRIPVPAAERIIRECDEDGDGLLDLDEFVEQFLPSSEDEKKKEKDRRLARERQIARIRKQRAAAEAAKKLAQQQPSAKKNALTTKIPSLSDQQTQAPTLVVATPRENSKSKITSVVKSDDEEYYSPMAPPPPRSRAASTELTTMHPAPKTSATPAFATTEVLGGLSLSLHADPVQVVKPSNEEMPIGLVFPLSQAPSVDDEANPLEMEERRADLWDMGVFLPVAKKLHITMNQQPTKALPDLPLPTVEADETESEEDIDPVRIAQKKGQKITHRPIPESVKTKQDILRGKIQQQSALLAESIDHEYYPEDSKLANQPFDNVNQGQVNAIVGDA